MPDNQSYIFAALIYLAAKHTIADFFLQTAYQYLNKGRYGHPGGLLHAFIHVVLTAPVFLIIAPASPAAGVFILLVEYALHYHIDWLKELALRTYSWTKERAAFWYALGVDQFAHQLTYIGIVAVLTSY